MSQDAVCAGWHGSGRGYALEDAVQILGGYYDPNPDWDTIGPYNWIRAKLQRSHWIIAYTFAAEIARISLARLPPPISLLGPLWNGGFGWLHAVVLIGADDERCYYLDPYFPAAGQPFSMSREDLAQALQGSVLVVPVG